MFGLKAKQCACGSKAFIGRRCVLCNKSLPETPKSNSPVNVVLHHFYGSWFLHLVPIWLIYGATLLMSDSIWAPSRLGRTPAGFYAQSFGLLSLGYLGAPLVAYLKGRGMRLPSQSEQKVAVVFARVVAMIVMILLTLSMVIGAYPNLR